MKNKLVFFGLLHIKNKENKNLNFRSANESEKILVYLKNAILLDKQLKNYGYRLILITNNKLFLGKLLRKLDYKINLKSVKFKTYVPPNTHFYSCHFRVDVFKHLSKLKNVYCILLDLDVLILNNPDKIFYFFKKKISLVNEISKNVIPAYGKFKILKNLKILNPKIDKVIWVGGDFFAGTSNFFRLMYDKTKFYQKKFIKNIKHLEDQTDELFMSASIYDLKKNKLLKIDYVNNLNIFTRYWNTNVLHFQKEINYYKKFIFLHIPADKIFLSKCYDDLKNKLDFKLEYFNHVSSLNNNLKIKLSSYIPTYFKKKFKYILNKIIYEK